MDIYRESGINRLSIGLQSAVDSELRALGRIHNLMDFEATFEAAVKVGFDNINVDIMSAIPTQTLSSFEKTLNYVTGLSKELKHISAYSLIVEEGTPFYEAFLKGNLDVPDEDTDRLMYELTQRVLGKFGFSRYEISNYAKAGFECRHNCGYWTLKEYLGLGLGASSFFKGTRFKNSSVLEEYCHGVLTDPDSILREVQILSLEDRMTDFMILGLRMTKGVSITDFQALFGRKLSDVFGDVIDKHIAEGLLVREGDRLFFSPKGLDLSNYVLADFL